MTMTYPQIGDIALAVLFIVAALVMAWSAVTSARDQAELWRLIAEARCQEDEAARKQGEGATDA
jgi:hypothetical protein